MDTLGAVLVAAIVVLVIALLVAVWMCIRRHNGEICGLYREA